MYMYMFVWISVYVFVDVSSYVDCVLEEVCHVLVFLHLRTTNVLGPDSIMRSEHAQQRRLSADIPTTSVCGDDALECESCSSRSCECTLFSFFAIPMGVIRDQLFCITLTLGRFASSLSCDFAQHGPHCSHVCAYIHHSLLLHLSLVFAFVTFSSQHYTLSNSYRMVRAPRLRSHWLPQRRLTALRPQAPCPAHSFHTVPSAHLFLRAPLAMSQAK